jgi:hypothetical protein
MRTVEQLSLPLTRDTVHLRDYFQGVACRPVSLFITDNSTSMVSVREKGKALIVRLHRMFLDAGDDVITEIAKFLKHRKGETPLLRKFLGQNSHRIKKSSPRKTTVKTEGKYHNLDELFHSLNSEYFDGRVSASITWGTRNLRYAVRKRTLGSYSRNSNIIRINPVLDRKGVPRYFIEFVAYHEMLHADMGMSEKNGRRSVHPREFKERERLFRHFKKAMAWEKGKSF